MRRFVLLLVLFVSARIASGLEVCPLTGDKTVVSEIQVLFDCPEASGEQAVRWFTSGGKFKGRFTIVTGHITDKVGPDYNFEPEDLRIAAASARGCYLGEYELKKDGSACYAVFKFPCVARKFRLQVAPEGKVEYSVTRLIPPAADKPAAPCKEDYFVPPTSTAVFSDTEKIEVKVFTPPPTKRLVGIYECDPQQIAVPCKPQAPPAPTPGRNNAVRNVEALHLPTGTPLPAVTITLQPSR